MAITRAAPASSMARVRPPGPGPISITVAPSSLPPERAMRPVRLRSRRKFCPSDLSALRPYWAITWRSGGRRAPSVMGVQPACPRHLPRHAERRDQARRIGDALSGDIIGGAVIGRGADEIKAERDIDAAVKINGFQRDQRLIMIHAEDGVILRPRRRMKQAVCGEGAGDLDALRGKFLNHRADDLDLFAPDGAAFAGMRVEAGNRQARIFKAEAGAEVRQCRPDHMAKQRSA